ncbi:MAG: zinc-binding alcohol dehydrogenase [Trueperaceae bacterium]|nr:MAG: zinc-binding alcohol dehydrogenase [Trueperaceae bacterium]
MHPPLNSRRVVVSARNEIGLEAFTLPPLEADQVLVQTHTSAISPGTELAFIQHKPTTPGQYPLYPGYSACGRVVERGEAVTQLDVGQLVALNIPHSSHAVLAAEACHPVDDRLSPAEVAPFRLVSIALQGIHRADIRLGSSVAITGLGPIGLLAGQLARAAGAGYVEGIDPLDWRRHLALACGLDAATPAAAVSDRVGTFEVVIEASGHPEVIPAAFQLAGPRGRVVLLGSPRGPTAEVDFYSDVHKKGLTVIGAHEIHRLHSDFEDEETALALMAARRIDVKPLISQVVAAEEAASAYERLAKREEHLMLLALDWS